MSAATGSTPNDEEMSTRSGHEVEGESTQSFASLQDNESAITNRRQGNDENGANKDFSDVRETGYWGSVTSTEKRLVAAVALVAAIIAILVVVAVVVINNNSADGEKEKQTEATPSPIPTPAPTFLPFTRSEQLDAILALMGNLNSTQESLEILPIDEEFYANLYKDPLQPPAVRGMSWVLYGDSRKEGPTSQWLVYRYALATLYYTTGGPSWTNSSNWLTNAHTCDWFGILCNSQGMLKQVDLQSNNLQNNLPNEIALLSEVRALWFRRNKLTGNLPAQQFNDLPVLRDLYLESNQFTGTIPSALAQSVPPLSTLFLHQNQFSGIFPLEFCSGPVGSPILQHFGVDCYQNACSCCNPRGNCF